MTGLLGFASGYYAIMDCDVLLMLGTDFPYPQFYPHKAMVAQVDVRAENLGRRGPLHLGLVGDVRDDAGGAAAAHRGKAQVEPQAPGRRARPLPQIAPGAGRAGDG